MVTRKIFTFLMAALLCLGLTACSEVQGSPTKSTQVPTTGKPSFGAPVVGAILPGGYDRPNTYSYDHHQQLLGAMTGLNMDVNTRLLTAENVAADRDSVRAAVRQLVEDGANMIFSTEFSYSPHMLELAEDYPDVIFCQLGGTERNGKNLVDYFCELYKAYYALGCFAGWESLSLETDAIGFVSAYGMENPDAVSAVNAFALGARYTNPDATVYLKVLEDPASTGQEEAAAMELVNRYGCGLLAQYTNSEVTLVTAAYLGITACGPYFDADALAPRTVLNSARFDWTEFYTKAIVSAQNSAYAYEFGSLLGTDRYFEPFRVDAHLSKTREELSTDARQLRGLLQYYLEEAAVTDPDDPDYGKEAAHKGIFSGRRKAVLEFLEGGGVFSDEADLDLVDNAGRVIVAAGADSLTTDEIRSMDFYLEGIIPVADANIPAA